ncbi:hypothetical protein F3Y22_tig00111088pilonHSYRG00172 [Hibiscus syriacus]|uniref:Uncharacterized protein n=1 Tax=Hibiscus syriacus TaxID=106335 RepID=A0A6A2Z2I2_HIBSY|nr:hypothetical protein F3Y22_tig00111088pilonHSYRG00172 [Hibiscus syriacus]
MEPSSVTGNSSSGNGLDQEHVLNHGGTDSNPEINGEEEQEPDEEQVRRTLQVLSEYPEAKMTIDEQNASLGETYLGLVTRLDEVIPLEDITGALSDGIRGVKFWIIELHCFIEGPPFTLQIICEIFCSTDLTCCKKHLSKTLKACPSTRKAGERDEIMTEADAGIEEMTIDMDAFQEIVGPSEANSIEWWTTLLYLCHNFEGTLGNKATMGHGIRSFGGTETNIFPGCVVVRL